jgi:hypothetical protein
MISILRFILIFIKWILVAGLFFAIAQHFITPIYKFNEPKKFAGNVIYNPYQNDSGVWLKMNLHAHARAWGGMTDGKKQNVQDIIQTYKQMNYDIIGVSNYHDPQSIWFKGNEDSLKVYEYGFNLFKAHRLVVGTKPVSFREVSLFHNIHDRQYLLNELHKENELVIIAHPEFGHGHPLSDFDKY